MTQIGYSVEITSVFIPPEILSRREPAVITLHLVTPSGTSFDVEMTEEIEDSIGEVDPAVRRALRDLAKDLRALAEVAETRMLDR